MNTAIKLFILWIIQFGTGNLVLHKNVKVNYTRKINHFALFFLPLLVDRMFPYEHSLGFVAVGCLIGLLSLVIYIHPIRSRINCIRIMFLSIDRPEDRPHTLQWLSTQVAVGYMVLIPMIILFFTSGHISLIFIPILIAGIGDGLAEPVGVRFGRFKYKTYALFTKKKYVRTLEGSACVLITAAIVILLYRDYFNHGQFVCALIAVPIVMTLAEALSPHTWDTPLLLFCGYGVLYLIKTIPF
jgi:phytol kinase